MLMMMCILSCPCPSVPTRITTTLLFPAYTINWVILLIVLFDGVMDNKRPFVIMSLSVLYCMSGAMNNVLSNGNHTNNNNNTAPSSSLSVDAVAVAVAMSWVRHVYGIGRHGNNYKSPSSTSLCVPVLGDWVPLGMYHFFPFSLPLFVLVLVGSSISPVVNSIPYLYLIRTIRSDSSSNSSIANCHCHL